MIDKTVFSINLWDVYQKEGRQCAEAGDLAEAVERFRAALQKAESYGENDPRVATSKRCLAEVYVRQGKTDEAEGLYKTAVELLEAELGEDSASLIKTLKSYADFLSQAERSADLSKVNRRIAEIESKSNETVMTSDIFEEAVPDGAENQPMTPEQRLRILELLQRSEISDSSRNTVMSELDHQPSFLWAHEVQGRLRQEIVRSYQPASLRKSQDD